ncbi:HEAT repeat domain-containing protein [Calothrix sp. PCC 7507]|uniref:HEAT repeat domain-containing protein n=1 Tax=Calothrix sp. PCC 7507 TaxID=99598 RepID=UPI00029EFCCB|nr:HEAT repeat domain-containing protein [Calothrix sp. PCC 7507]AFY34089.1 PBS lyase HEAT domain protein repeat-containing protein [Calothrix sp. PCC 7507]
MNKFDSHNTEELILQINNAATPETALAAITALGASGTQALAAISALMQSLSHHHVAVRAAAVEVLVKLAPATVKPLIAAFTSSQDQGLQAHIIQALAQIGNPEALDLLAEVVGTAVANHCQGNVRRIAARGLGEIGRTSSDTEIISRVEQKLTWALLTPEDWGLRYAAAISLQELATIGAGMALQQAIAQEVDQVVRSRITIALTALPTAVA